MIDMLLLLIVMFFDKHLPGRVNNYPHTNIFCRNRIGNFDTDSEFVYN